MDTMHKQLQIAGSMGTKKRYTCPHGRQCKSRCSDCIGHPVNQGKCSRCKKLYSPSESDVSFNGKPLQTCTKCRYQSDCKHGKRLKKECKRCKHEQSLCNHNQRRSRCIVCSPCPHGSIQERCHDCNECIHGNHRKYCCECSGCEHRALRHRCRICNPSGHMAHSVRTQVRDALRNNKVTRTVDYLGCSMEDFKIHIERQFTLGMSWENYGPNWHIDHIVPLKYPVEEDGVSHPPTVEEVIKRLHYTNCQPMWASENITKGNRYIG